MSRNSDFSFASFDGMSAEVGNPAALQVLGLDSNFGSGMSGGMDTSTISAPTASPVMSTGESAGIA